MTPKIELWPKVLQREIEREKRDVIMLNFGKVMNIYGSSSVPKSEKYNYGKHYFLLLLLWLLLLLSLLFW